MTCVPGDSYKFITRPYPFKRDPFQLASGELVTYEGIYFSIPASGLMLEKRLFTSSASHPVASTVRLYINKDGNISSIIEPDDDGAVYTSGTPHYADYILDLRNLIDAVGALHAADSDHAAIEFRRAQIERGRSVYDVSSYETSPYEFFHPEPANSVPSGESPVGVSGSVLTGDGHELGAQQIMDIDMDEVQWQVLARPKKQATATPASIPVEPIFPMVLAGGDLPSINSERDEINLDRLGLGGIGSGGVIITGDGCFAGTSIKLVDASGAAPSVTGNFLSEVEWKQFPCGNQLCTYYTPDIGSGLILAKGRQGIYEAPGGLANGVYMLILSETASTSGYTVQHWPGNYYSTSGIDPNGHAHNGVHVVDKLLYNIDFLSTNNIAAGYSPINGKKVFLHWVGSDVGSKGETFSTAGPTYVNGDNIYGAGDIVTPALSSFTTTTQNWFSANTTFAPINWSTLFTTALQPRRGLFGARNSTNFIVADIQAGATRGVITRQLYTQFGAIDRIVSPDLDQAQGGNFRTVPITYHTIQYREGTDINGDFEWVQEDEYDTIQPIQYWENIYTCGNIFSFYFLLRPNNGFVHANGNIYVQWSDKIGTVPTVPYKNKFAPIGGTTTRLSPPTNRSDVTVSVGFFPNWRLIRYVTTNNQVVIPDTISISPSNSLTITFDSALGFDSSFVKEYGCPVWDPDEGVNYIYFRWDNGSTQKVFFAHMNTSFVITRINQVDSDEGILFGRMALLSI